MFIDGFGIAGYRSFGPDIQRIGPFGKINFFIGRNNSGKSNILRFISEHYTFVIQDIDRAPTWPKDMHIDRPVVPAVEIGLKIGSLLYNKMLDCRREKLTSHELVWEKLFRSELFADENDVAWVSCGIDTRNQLLQKSKENHFSTPEEQVRLNDLPTCHEMNACREKFTNIIWHKVIANDIVLKVLIPLMFPFDLFPPKIEMIHAIREIHDDNDNRPSNHSGRGLIESLAKLERPPHDNQQDRDRFKKINHFLQTVAERPEAKLEIQHDHKVINVFMNGKYMPLESLGTGIHEVIILAAAATVLENQVLCIEEPELHLHPRLQKQLVRYLEKETNNQYFITTHSAHLLDTPGAAVFHVQLENNESIVRTASTDRHKSQICDDLGYRASDILQANCIIWVEGPSDRIYLNYWISKIDPTLEDKLHYSVMFYGGKLLSHLTADDNEIDEFINLNQLNRHTSILIDSDREKKGAKINATKCRIRDEIDKGPGFTWITKGREVENYILPDFLEKAVIVVHETVIALNDRGIYDNCLKNVKRKIKKAIKISRLTKSMLPEK